MSSPKKVTAAKSTSQKSVPANTQCTAPGPGLKLPDFDSSIIDVRLTNQEGGDLNDKSVFVERAISSNSVCALCQQTIAEGSLRMGLRTDSSLGDFSVVRWNHLCCFPFIANRYPSLVVCPQDIRGISLLSSEKDIKDVLRSTLLDTTKGLSKSISEAAAKLEKAFEVVSLLTTSQLTKIANDAGYKFGAYAPGRASLISYITDAVVFGAVDPCKECKGGLLTFNDFQYKCKGYLDSFTRCSFVSKNVTRSPLLISCSETRTTLERTGACPGLKNTSTRPTVPEPCPPVADRPNTPPRTNKLFEPFRVFLHPSAHDVQPLLLAGGIKQDNLFLNPKDWAHAKPGEGPDGFRDIVVIRDPFNSYNVGVKKAVILDKGFVEAVSRLGYHPGYIAFEDKAFCCSLSILQKRSQRQKIKDKLDVQVVPSAADADKKMVVRVKGEVAIDPDAINFTSDNAMVPKFDDAHPYHASLSKTDFVSGKNSFYILQLIHDTSPKEAGKHYLLFRKWGRVGDALRTGTKCESFSSKYSAISQFKKIFLERAGYQWSEKATYEGKDPIAGHYTLLSIQTMSSLAPAPADSAVISEPVKKLEKPTEDLVRRLFDVSAINDSLVEMEIDVKKLPLGNITDAVIQRGLTTLQTIQTVVSDMESKKKRKPLPEQQRKLVALNNQFYTYIPHAITKEEMRSNKLLLDTSDKIGEKVQLLTDLGQIAVTAKLLSQSSNSPHTHYNMLKTEMVVVPSSDPRFKMVEKYMKDTHGPTHRFKAKLRNLWCIEREGEHSEYTSKHKDNHNRMLLWHGSRFTNWVGILSKGLRIAPPEAPVTGYMFGKGIYFADMFSKSAQYATSFSGRGEGMLSLVEVALGKSGVRYRSDYVKSLPSDELSIHAKGKYQPKGFTSDEDGLKIPQQWAHSDDSQLGSLLYNEYIVYTENQVRMKYLCQVDFE